jgi:hypothetical protein
MNTKTDRARRATISRQAERWVNLGAEAIAGPGFRLWLSRSSVHAEEALGWAFLYLQIRSLSADDWKWIHEQPEPIAEHEGFGGDEPDDQDED